jgi:hypothetical protein
MKRVAGVLCVMAVVLFVFAQEKSQVTVKSGMTTSNGVVIVTAEEGKKAIELQCNEGLSDCAIPRAGTYVMVRLPKNRGLYECACVQLYESNRTGEAEKKVGEYCLK